MGKPLPSYLLSSEDNFDVAMFSFIFKLPPNLQEHIFRMYMMKWKQLDTWPTLSISQWHPNYITWPKSSQTLIIHVAELGNCLSKNNCMHFVLMVDKIGLLLEIVLDYSSVQDIYLECTEQFIDTYISKNPQNTRSFVYNCYWTKTVYIFWQI